MPSFASDPRKYGIGSTVMPHSNGAGGIISGIGNSSGSFSSGTNFEPIPITDIPPPTQPNYSEIEKEYAGARSYLSPRRINKTMDALIATTRAMAGQGANNASRAYSQRLMQSGVAPVSGGVVGAQVRMAGNREANNLAAQKEQMAHEARKDASMIASQMASEVGKLREAYSRTLADYNARNAQMKQQAQMFNNTSMFEEGKFNASNSLAAEELAAKIAAMGASKGGGGGGNGGGFKGLMTPGYIPNIGAPIIPATLNGVPMNGQVFTPGSIEAMGYTLDA